MSMAASFPAPPADGEQNAATSLGRRRLSGLMAITPSAAPRVAGARRIA